MKTWQIFIVGVCGLVLALFLPVWQSWLAGLGALAIVAVVVIGFLLTPRKDTFYIRSTTHGKDADGILSIAHDCLAVRVELTRLWVLFIPTFGALAFLLSTYARGTTWKFTLLGDLSAGPGYVLYTGRIVLVVVAGILSAWLGERRILRDFEACRAGSVSLDGAYISYHYVDSLGEYYGGEGCLFGSPRAELGTLVLYHVRHRQLSRIGMGLLFHKLVVIGRGVPDLDQAKSPMAIEKAIMAPGR